MLLEIVEQKQYQGPMEPSDQEVHRIEMRLEKSTASPSFLTVVDDDENLRESLLDLLREVGFASMAFSSGSEFLSSDCVDRTTCLILDVAMTGMSGLELQRELNRRGKTIPIIFVTAHRDEAIRKQALAQGAVTLLYKPFSDTALLDAVTLALRRT